MSGMVIPQGFSVEVTAPATSANLGAGYDSFGLALGFSDTVRHAERLRCVAGSACDDRG